MSPHYGGLVSIYVEGCDFLGEVCSFEPFLYGSLSSRSSWYASGYSHVNKTHFHKKGLTLFNNLEIFWISKRPYSLLEKWHLICREEKRREEKRREKRRVVDERTTDVPSLQYFNMWTVSSDVSIQRRHWQPLSVHLRAYCTNPTRDVNDVTCVVLRGADWGRCKHLDSL